jgi:hypothetical protein
MRAIRYTARFKRDYRREKSGVLGKKLDGLLMEAVELLVSDKREAAALRICPRITGRSGGVCLGTPTRDALA